MITLADIQSACSPELLASRDYQAIADAVSAARIPVLGKIERAEFAMWAASCGMRSKIEDHAADKTSPLRDAALACKDVIQGAATSIDFALLPNQQMLGAWVALGQLSTENHDLLLAMASHLPDPVSLYDLTVVLQDTNGNWRI